MSRVPRGRRGIEGVETERTPVLVKIGGPQNSGFGHAQCLLLINRRLFSLALGPYNKLVNRVSTKRLTALMQI